ncbi:hypothetical protein RHMOL_Rhmol03G0181800 [Rhododendron molle]|uniref:Uncharacterized protein n=1 Tax=Rhododendron molle TaxID=49168 RepID=A0ACC0PH10_RHOML|nr:hypothetical protein RHMOL_Rhmol03G0181800 [Rhododendron molle]
MRKLFSLRQIAQSFTRSIIGNGQSTFLWLDNWHNLGPLYLKYGDRVAFNMGRSLTAKVSSIINNGEWHWPRRRNPVIAEIIHNTDASLIPAEANEDRVIWTLSSSESFTSKSAWSAIRTKAPEAPWHAIVWHKGLVPRWAFILWVAILG